MYGLRSAENRLPASADAASAHFAADVNKQRRQQVAHDDLVAEVRRFNFVAQEPQDIRHRRTARIVARPQMHRQRERLDGRQHHVSIYAELYAYDRGCGRGRTEDAIMRRQEMLKWHCLAANRVAHFVRRATGKENEISRK